MKAMKFKEVEIKEKYFSKNYPFYFPPKLTDKRKCIHCGSEFIVADFKVRIIIDEDGEDDIIVCPNAPKCDGNVLDWVQID